MKTDMMYGVLYGYSGLASEGVQLDGVKEVADYILTHSGGMVAEEDGTPLLEIWDGKFEYCNDMQYRELLMAELRKYEGFEDRHWL